VKGVRTDKAVVHVRFGNAAQWETAPMQAARDGEFAFTLYALREPLSYYITSGGMKSAEHRIAVADLPRVQRMRLTYEYPDWTGLKPESDDRSRDIEAVAGTKVNVEIETDAPLDSPTLVVSTDPSGPNKSALSANGTRSTGTLVLDKEGHYQVSARIGNELVPLTEEYRITLVPDGKPIIEIAKPGRDWHASSIEEVPVHVRASDDFRVQGLELRYSINGGDWKSAPLKGRAKEVTSDTTLRLEELGAKANNEQPTLVPGDIVTYYAVAKDRQHAVQTDLFLIQVQPFERSYRQMQAANGQNGGGGDQDENAISERQREILLATWNLQKNAQGASGRDAERIRDNARMLAEVQKTLAEQARTLIDRTQARALVDADQRIRAFVKNLEDAANAMQPAAEHLNGIKLRQAIPSEQKALQHLLRAEALFTEIQVAFQRSNSGGGGSQAGRDLAEMFELEMDLEKNQYETESQVAKDSTREQIDEAARKLKELAQRQERLEREAANQRQAMREQQRWRQEQLRRETEDLRKRLEQLAKQQQGQGQSSQNGQGQRSASNSPAAEALNQIDQALESMERASGEGSGGSGSSGSSERTAQNSESQRNAQASRNLNEALRRMERQQRQGMSGSFDELANRARQLLDEQRRTEAELQAAFGQGRPPGSSGGNDRGDSGYRRPGEWDWEQLQTLADRKRAMQSELQALDADMRTSAQKHQKDAPAASKRLAKAAEDAAESRTSAQLARSARDIERGRALEASAREGMITEALTALERDLGQAAQVASNEVNERGQGPGEASPEELLAELGELRRAWQQAQNAQQARERAGGRDPSQNGDRAGGPGDPTRAGQNDRDRQASLEQLARGDRNENPRAGAHGENASNNQRTAGSPRGSERGGANSRQWGDGPEAIGSPDGINRSAWSGATRGPYSGHFIEGDRGRLSAWNPPLARDALRSENSAEFREQAEQIGRRLRELTHRMPRGSMADADIAALRQLADSLRRQGGDPMQSQYPRMVSLVDQLELAALNASESAKRSSTRATTPVEGSPRYRENVAEYYRRLGSSE
jgi:hypothetical protein